MSLRASSVVVALVCTIAVPARALAQRQPPPSYQDLAAQIADLQARVATLEGSIVASDLAGTYALTGLSTTMTAFHAVPLINATINTSAGRGTLTLNADGTGFFGPFTCEGSTLTQGSWAMHGFNCSQSGVGNVTWTYANGVVTTLDDSGEQLPFDVALGGRFLILAFAPFHPGDPSSDQALLIATRLR
jgi:hypothetical protein